VVTATPVHRIGERPRAAVRWLSGGDEDEDETSLADRPTMAQEQVGRRPFWRRRRQPPPHDDEPEYVGDEPFATAAITEPAYDSDPDDADAPAVIADDERTTVLAAPAPTPVPRGEQPMLDGDVIYTLPSEELLAKGMPHKV